MVGIRSCDPRCWRLKRRKGLMLSQATVPRLCGESRRREISFLYSDVTALRLSTAAEDRLEVELPDWPRPAHWSRYRRSSAPSWATPGFQLFDRETRATSPLAVNVLV